MFQIPLKYTVLAIGVVVALSTAVVAYAIHEAHVQRDARTVAELRLAGQKRINDSTVARLASTTSALKDSLGAVLDANKDLHGKLLAALAIRVPKRDTIFVHDTVKTTVYVDGSRTGTFRDSSWVGVVEGTMTAPPFPAPLGVTLHFTRPEFRPEVAFYEVGGQGVAVVSWQGERFQVEAPYVSKAALSPARRVGAALGAFWMAPGGVTGRAEGWTRVLGHIEVLGGAEARLKASPGEPNGRAYAGLRWVF